MPSSLRCRSTSCSTTQQPQGTPSQAPPTGSTISARQLRGASGKHSPSPTPLAPPPSTPLPPLPPSSAFMFPLSPSRTQAYTPSLSQTATTSLLRGEEPPRRSNPEVLAQRYSQPFNRPTEAVPRPAIGWASPNAGTSPRVHQTTLPDIDGLVRRPSIGSGLPTAYVHSLAHQPMNLDAAPYLPAALGFDKATYLQDYPDSYSGVNPANFRPAIVGWAKPASTSYPIVPQPEGRDPFPSPAKSGQDSRAASSVNSNHSSDNLNSTFHPYDRTGGSGQSAETSMTSLRTYPSLHHPNASGSKLRSQGATPSSQRHRRGEPSSGHGSASSAGAAAMVWSDSGGHGSTHAAVRPGSSKTPASLRSVASDEAGQSDRAPSVDLTRPNRALGTGPASKSVGASLASGRQPRSVASVPDLRASQLAVPSNPTILEPEQEPEPEPQVPELQDEAVTTRVPEPVEETSSPRTAQSSAALRVETPTGTTSMYDDLASHRPQAPLSPIPSSMASPYTDRRGDGSSASPRDLNSVSGTPQQSSRSNGSRTDSNATTGASPGRHPELARLQQPAQTAGRTPSPQLSDTSTTRERKLAQAKFHLLQQLHLVELILHSVEYTGVLEPANGCEAVFRPRPTLRTRDSHTLKSSHFASASERRSASSSGHSTIVPLEAGFERHRTRKLQGRGATQAHRRNKTEGGHIVTDIPVDLNQLFGQDRWSHGARQGTLTGAQRQPFFHHRMPPEPPKEAGQAHGPGRAAALIASRPAGWCADAGDVSVDTSIKGQPQTPPPPKFATLPVEKRQDQPTPNVELVYRMRSVPVGSQPLPKPTEKVRQRKRSAPLPKQPPTPDLIHSASSPEIDDLETPDLATVIADGIWLDEQRSKWREQHRKSLDGSPAVVAWRRRSRSRSRSRSQSMSRTLNELPPDSSERGGFLGRRRSNTTSSAPRDDADLDPRGGVLAELRNKYREADDSPPRGRVTRQAIDDDRRFREHQREQFLRHSRSSPQLRTSAMFAKEAKDVPLPGRPSAKRRHPAQSGLALNQEAEAIGYDRGQSPEIPTSFHFARRRVQSLGRESGRKSAATAASQSGGHRRHRSASLSPERLSEAALDQKKHRKPGKAAGSTFFGFFHKKGRSPIRARVAQPMSNHKYRTSTTSGPRKRVHRTSESWDRAVQTEEPLRLTGEERLSTIQNSHQDVGVGERRSVVTDLPVVIATAGDRTSFRNQTKSGHEQFRFPALSSHTGSNGALEVPAIAIGLEPGSGSHDNIVAAYATEPLTLFTAGRHATQVGYHRQQDSSDLRAMLRDARSHDQDHVLDSLPAPPRRRGQSMSSEGRHGTHSSNSDHQTPVPQVPQQQPFHTPQFMLPPTPQIQERSASALSGSDPRSTPASFGGGSHSGSGSNPQVGPGGRSGSSPDSYETQPGSRREVWMMDSVSREDDEDPQFQGLFFMPPRDEGSIPRSPHTGDARNLPTFTGSSLTVGLRRSPHGHVDDELDDEIAEEIRPTSEERFAQLAASRASSGISRQLPHFTTSASSPGQGSSEQLSPSRSSSQGEAASTIGHGNIRNSTSARNTLIRDSFSPVPPLQRSGSNRSTAALAASRQDEPGLRLGHVAGAEQTPQFVDHPSMSRASSSQGHKTPSIRRNRRPEMGADAAPRVPPAPASITSDHHSVRAPTITGHAADITPSTGGEEASVATHADSSALDESDLEDGKEGDPRNDRLLSFASHTGEIGAYEDEDDQRAS
ncbi:hypothetical protein V8E36_003846 [Tilletia maclaganii]